MQAVNQSTFQNAEEKANNKWLFSAPIDLSVFLGSAVG
jgi:hypothetical protein